MPPVAVLVGPPGSGKTTVGSALADALGVTLRDTDADVEAGSGRSIPDIFVTDGEPAFRALEAAAVATALADHDGVLALGGGAIEDPATRARLAGHFVVRLHVGAAEAAKRVGLSQPRPLLLGNVRTKWGELMRRRDPLYAEVATVTIDTDARDVADIVAEIRTLREAQP